MIEFDFLNYPVKRTICSVSQMLVSMIQINDAYGPHIATCFHSQAIPKTDVLNRVIQATRTTAIPFVINSHTLHQLLITSIVVASKYTSDIYFTNSRYAQVAGISGKELNELEMEFLFLLQFDLMVHPLDLKQFANHLLNFPVAPLSGLRIMTPPPESVNEDCVVDENDSFSRAVDSCHSRGSSDTDEKQKDDHIHSDLASIEQIQVIDPGLLEAIFNPQNQVSCEKQREFLVLLSRCSRKILLEKGKSAILNLVH
ncbi:cyclin-like protein interacting with PHO85 [Basidiobolus ranarum]|uniref:Cyclin-like protein interacting with PHO85 n=1 Tax=Basidiobolus ranarum TaxID=34480 RepID=A0ABR2WY49_9FUNG